MVKKEKPKRRRYLITCQMRSDNPMIKMSGKWLQECGFGNGNAFEVIEGKNMLILAKVSSTTVLERKRALKRENLKKDLQRINNILLNMN